MLKIRGNIIFITGLILVIFIWIGSPASSSGENLNICATAEMQTSDELSGSLNIQNEVCEDEQLNQLILCSSIAEPAVYFFDNQNSSLIFQPCLIPWEPPKI